jgi:uncharacterized protein YcsI (UPF0317 family)
MFLAGCSFTFESALVRAGIQLKHRRTGVNVPMFYTDRACRPAGGISGPLVVSMRPVPPRLIATAVEVTARFPMAHGAPVHIGDPAALGISDIGKPDFGDPVEIGTDIPVFWACGVTQQAAVMASKPEFAITHAPGHMLICDVPESFPGQ